MTHSITKRMKEFLVFMDEKESVSLFPIEWSVMRKKAKAAGFIALDGVSEQTGFNAYSLTPSGRAALEGKNNA